MRMSVLQDIKLQQKLQSIGSVLENKSILENLMSLSFDCRRSEAKVKWLETKMKQNKTNIN